MPTNLCRQVAPGCLILLLGAIYLGGEAPGAGSLFAPPWDKVVHLLAFGSIGVFVTLSFPAVPVAAIPLIVAAAGAADEFHQVFLPGRQAGFDDWLADLLGGMLALPIVAHLRLHHSSVPRCGKGR